MKFLRKHNEESTRLLEAVKDEGDHDKYKMVYWVRERKREMRHPKTYNV